METLARVLYVFESDPILIFKGTKYLFDTDETIGKYWYIFGDDGKEADIFDSSRLKKIAALFFMWTLIEDKIKSTSKQLKKEGKETSHEYQALLAKWHFLWAYGYILNKFYSNELSNIYKRISEGVLLEDDNNFILKWFRKVHKTISKCIKQNYQAKESVDKKNQIQSFNLKNWLRNEKDFEILKSEFEFAELEDYPLK
ncbi:MAG TPA: hypothetical protein VI757_11945 [Bacteroidia bacterium]|nr:hypothetical protein [Bacteroidia bacterium]